MTASCMGNGGYAPSCARQALPAAGQNVFTCTEPGCGDRSRGTRTCSDHWHVQTQSLQEKKVCHSSHMGKHGERHEYKMQSTETPIICSDSKWTPPATRSKSPTADGEAFTGWTWRHARAHPFSVREDDDVSDEVIGRILGLRTLMAYELDEPFAALMSSSARHSATDLTLRNADSRV